MATPTVQGKNQKDTVAGATQVTKNARLIIQQADVAHIKEIPNLPTHQAAARVQANKWINDYWPQIIKITADIIDFANTYQATYDQLKTLAPKLQDGDETTKKEFIQALEVVLISGLQEKSKNAKSIATSIKQFHDEFLPLYNKFLVDFTQADKKLSADNAEIATKTADLTKWEGKADGYEHAAVGMSEALPITATAKAIFSETGVALLIGGILMAVELVAMGTMLGLYADAMHHVNNLTNEINALNTQLAQLKLIKKQISDLQKHTLTVVTTSANVADGWVALEQDMNKTIAHLKKITPQEIATIINIQLEAASKEWGVALKHAEKLQPNGGRLSKKTFSSSKDMLNAIDQQAGKKTGA